MPGPTAQEIKTWLRQCEKAPAVVVLGTANNPVENALRACSCQCQVCRPGDKRFWVDAMAMVQRVKSDQVLCTFLTSGVYGDNRENMLGALPRGPNRFVVDCADSTDAASVYRTMSQAIAVASPRASTSTPADKNRLSAVPHHRPQGFEKLAAEICEIEAVAQVRFRKGSGADRSSTVVGTEVHVHFEERRGLAVDCTTSHPLHLEQIRTRIQALVDQY